MENVGKMCSVISRRKSLAVLRVRHYVVAPAAASAARPAILRLRMVLSTPALPARLPPVPRTLCAAGTRFSCATPRNFSGPNDCCLDFPSPTESGNQTRPPLFRNSVHQHRSFCMVFQNHFIPKISTPLQAPGDKLFSPRPLVVERRVP